MAPVAKFKAPGVNRMTVADWPSTMGISGAGLEATASTAALASAIAEGPAGAEALVSAPPYELWALAEAVAPLAPVELAVAAREAVVFDAAASELAIPPAPP